MYLLDKNNQKLSYAFLLLEICAFLILIYLGPWLQPDSGGYIDAGVTRSALYPLILKLYMFVFNNNFYVLVILQMILGFTAIHYATRLFAKLFDLNFYSKSAIFMLFLSPYVGPTLIGNTILTEPICYPLFIFAFGELIKGIMNKNYKNLIASILWAVLLVLTRKQFIFLYPLMAMVLAYIFIRSRFFVGKYLVLFAFIISIIGANILEKTYHYVYHGVFADVPFTGFQLVNGPIFVSKKSDIDLFIDPIEKRLFSEVYASMEKNGYLMSQDIQPGKEYYPYYQKYYAVYTTICYNFITQSFKDMKISDPFISDKILVNVALKLIMANPINYLKVITQNALQNMGGYYMLFLLLLTWAFAGVNIVRHDCEKSVLFFIVITANFGNFALVTLVEPVLRRYVMYTEIFTISLIFCVLLSFMQSSKMIKNRTVGS